MNSIEYIAEQFFIELFNSNNKLTGLQFRHDEEDAEVPDDVVAISAESGEKQLEGPKAYSVTVTIEYRTTTGNKFNAKLVEGQLRDSIDAATAGSTSGLSIMALINDLYLMGENVTSSRTRDGKIRGLEITVPILIIPETLV
jgi:hypothetical protein